VRILIVKLSSLGDVVQTLPVLHDIRRHLPDVTAIDWVAEEAFVDLLRTVPGIERVLPYAQRRWRNLPRSATRVERRAFWRSLREARYDAVIDFQGLVKSAWVARRALLTEGGFSATFGNASELCAYEWPVRWMVSRALPMPRRMHAVARTRYLAATAMGYDPGVVDTPPAYPWAAEPGKALPWIVLAHGTTRADNEWPQANWIAIGRRLVAEGLTVRLPQANAREERVASLIAQGIGEGARVLPRMGLAALLGEMRDGAGLIGVDTGLSHLGVALGLPVVEIFSQPRAWRAGPVGRAHQRAVGGDRPPDVHAVMEAWAACWAARPGQAQPVPA